MLKRLLLLLIGMLCLVYTASAAPKVYTIEVKRVVGDKDSPDGLRRAAELEAIHQAIGQAGLFHIEQEINWVKIEDEAGYRERYEQILKELCTTAGITCIWKTDEYTKVVENNITVYYFTFEIEIDPDRITPSITPPSSTSTKKQNKTVPGYRVRVLSTLSEDKALELANKLETDLFVKVYIDLRDEWKVNIGDFVLRENAQLLCDKLKTEDFPTAWVTLLC